MGGETLERLPIRTARLTLRPPREDDAPRLAALANDYEVAKMTASFPHPYGLQDALAYVAWAGACDPRREAIFAIDLDGEGAIGAIGFHPNESPAPEVGYWIGQPFWNRGIASEMLPAAMAWAGGDWGKRFVTAGHYADNPASGTVLCKAGFLYTGEVEMKLSRSRGEAAPLRRMVWLA